MSGNSESAESVYDFGARGLMVDFVLGVIVVGRRSRGRDDCPSALTTAKLDAALVQCRRGRRQKPLGDRGMNEQALGRVAHSRSLAFRIHEDASCHFEIGRLVHVNMAIAAVMLEHRHCRFTGDPLDEPFATARNY